MTITNPYFIYKYILNSFQMKQEPSYYRNSVKKIEIDEDLPRLLVKEIIFQKNDSFHF